MCFWAFFGADILAEIEPNGMFAGPCGPAANATLLFIIKRCRKNGTTQYWNDVSEWHK